MELDFKKIKGFAMDVDGVLTDGGLLCDIDGELFRTFDAKDGFAVRMAALNGYAVGIITGGRSGSIRARMHTSGVSAEDVYLRSWDKLADLKDFCSRHGIGLDEVVYFGDDTPDAEALRAAGIGVCPSDAATDAREAADFISPFPGGKGCVRDVIEKTLRAQGRWNFDVNEYERRF